MIKKDLASYPRVFLLCVSLLATLPFLLVQLCGSRLYQVLGVSAYLTFHNVTEIFSVMVSLAIFGLGWYSFNQSGDRHVLFLSAAFLGIGVMDFMHALGYAGMPPLFTANAAEGSTPFWIDVRLFNAACFLASGFIRPAATSRWLGKIPLLLGVLGVSALVFTGVSLFPEWVPAAFLEGDGLATLKNLSGGVIVAMLLLAAAVYWRRFRETENTLYFYYLCAFILSIFSEICFSVNRSVFDSYNVLGHIYKVAAFGLIYHGIFAAAVKKPYRELRHTNDLLLHVMDSIPHSIFWKDRTCRYLGCNREFSSRAGLADPAQVVCKTDHDLPWGFKDREGYLADDREVMESGLSKMHIVESLQQGDGSVIWIDTSKIPLTDADGTVRGVLGVYEDITARKLADERLSESIQFNQEIINSVREGIVVYDRELRYLLWNPFLEELTGVSCAEVLGKRPEELFPSLSEAGVVRRLERLLTGGTVPVVEFPLQIQLTGRNLWLSDASSSLRSASGEIVGVIGTVRDITGRRAIEDQLRQAQKLESVGRLAGGVAHDFNNKLTVIMGNAELASLHSGDQKLKEYLKHIVKAAEQSRDITSQLLAFSRQQVISPRPVRVNDLLAELRKSLGRLIGEDICIVLVPGEKLWIVNIDPVQLDQIIMNLTVNARDAMPQGGTITIETSNVTLAQDAVLYPDASPGDYVRIQCRDSGAGMDSETIRHIFEPFFTTKEQGKGTGLGLSTVYGIVRQNGGFIEVETEPGQGSSFGIYLPRRHGETELQDESGQAPAPQGSGTVMLVEDEEMVREMTRSMIESLGYSCIEVFGPQEALAVAENPEVDIDLVLTDVVMPGINGQDMMGRIREMRPELKGIYMSGFSQDVIDEERAAVEEMAFIRKPFTREDLATVVKQVLAGDR